ncbi:MAG: hypothetical protein IJC73_02535 [Lentisphaeria bacterium]|nr:hypothetical protein [Lentisphaeria bacterium]
MKTLILLAVSLLTACCVSAGTIRFRGGDVLAAELGRTAPTILNGDKIAALQNTSGKYFARVAVRLTPGRKLSTEDFSLYCFGTKYRCLAVSTNGAEFDASQWLIAPENNAVCYLLFVLDGTLIAAEGVTRIDLKCNAPGAYPDATLPFVNRGSEALSSSVSGDGIL